MNTTSTTPALARADRSTRYTLARQLSIAGQHVSPYTVMLDLLDALDGEPTVTTFTNSIG